jgi:PAS domain S-box-containing protein
MEEHQHNQSPPTAGNQTRDRREPGAPDVSETHRSPLRLLITTIAAIFIAEVVAMIAVYELGPIPYYQTTLVDAGIMTLLIFPVLYYFSFRPLIRQMEKGWQAEEKLLQAYDELELHVQERTEELRIANTVLEREVHMRKQTEAALRKSELGLKRAQSIAHLGNWELDLVANQLTWSDEVYRIFGLQPQEFSPSYEAFLETVHPEDRAAVDEAYSNSIRDHKDGYEIEHRLIRRSDGEIRVVHEKCEHVRNEAGEIVRSVGMVHDITERKQAEQALRRSEAFLLQTGQMAEVGGWELDLQTMTPVWSSETYRIHEVDPACALQLDIATDFYTPEARPVILDAVRKAIEEGQSYDLELPLITAGGNPIWIRTIGHSVFQDGKCVRLFGAIQDITQRKQAQEELRLAHDQLELRVQKRTQELAELNKDLLKEIGERKEIERQLRVQATAMEAAANGIVVTDPLGNIRWSNSAICGITGYSPDELVGQNMNIFKSSRQGDDYYRKMWATILSGHVWRGEITNRRKDGSYYTEEQTITPVRDELGQISQFIAIKQDVTERRLAEEALRASEEKFRTLVEWTYDWEIWLDPSGNVVYNSPSCERITGYGPEEFISDPELMTRIVHPADQPAYRDHQHIVHDETAAVQNLEYRIVGRDGKERWIEHVCRPLFGADQQYLGRRMSNRDITEQKKAERDLQKRNQKEKILRQTIHTMQLDIARDLHDTIGQNISFLRMKLDYLASKKIKKQSQVQAEIETMATAADESYDLIRGTLAVLQSEDSSDLFRLFTRYAEQIEERSGFKTKFSGKGEPRFMSARRMRQLFYVFREVLNNIEKHANALEVSIEMVWDQDSLKLVVCDNGDGFDQAQLPYSGHYGLRFMKERIELLNGSLSIRSAVGSGTTILLEVPYE